MKKTILLALGCGSLLAAPLTQAQTTITAWTFDNLPTGVNASPAPSTSSGTASALGMSNSYNSTTSVSTPDVLSSPGSSTPSGPNAWRVRGQNPGNGWSSQAPIGTQGAEFDESTAGYSGIHIYFDVNTTAQAEANQLQRQPCRVRIPGQHGTITLLRCPENRRQTNQSTIGSRPGALTTANGNG